MKYKKYAQILIDAQKKEADFSSFFDIFIAYLGSKQEITLLPSIFKEVELIRSSLERDNKTHIVVTDRDSFQQQKKDIERFKKEFDVESATIEENKNIVGGYVIKKKGLKVDNSYRKKLLEMYQNIIE